MAESLSYKVVASTENSLRAYDIDASSIFEVKQGG